MYKKKAILETLKSLLGKEKRLFCFVPCLLTDHLRIDRQCVTLAVIVMTQGEIKPPIPGEIFSFTFPRVRFHASSSEDIGNKM